MRSILSMCVCRKYAILVARNMIEKIREIVAPYGVRVIDVELITKGFLSENFKVVCEEGVFFLKQYRAALDEKRVMDIHASKNFFAQQGLPAVMPLANEAGAYYIFHEGKFYSLFPFVSGNTYPDQHCSVRELESLARMLARAHSAGAAAPANYIEKKFQRKNIGEAIAYGNTIVAAIQEEMARTGGTDFDSIALQIAQKKISLLAAWPYPELQERDYVLAHHDLHAGNVFFDEDGEVRHVFDFELSQYEPAAFDVVRTMTIVCMDYGSAEEKWARVAAFLRAYREVRELSDEELLYGVLEFVRYRTTSFWVEEEHYLKQNARVDRFLEWDDVSRVMWIEWLAARK